jgi:hypothetical protein
VTAILTLPTVPPVALFLAHQLVPAIRYLAGAVRRTNPRRSA